ncbi:SpoIIE-like protein with response regulator receiver domain protein [Mesotoga sp. HF07.pep.5.2.highcov]|uniref:PP2C family protein-serine/threonine phosphatase n=1 Tax=Mesotoga TaxID=1184396 RepID=UPI000C183AD8|nr:MULTISPECIES: SpoIIE family protein phosphatase [Mesotoga]RLL84077.1 SpoIIE-like protein with response regulator receiver domain protein [Mesotoga sp. H07pep.5.4]RLL89636.1 SpoIIE-like protein with response regulator receiver domain protein [Mesotoga sp. HF07.pep.5.2.highcov]
MSRILVVDDDLSVRVLLKSILSRDNHDVVESADGRSAFSSLAVQKPDIVLLDLMLPDYNGLDILAQLKESEELEPIPVIVLTGSSDRESKLTALSSGAVDFISKPFLPEEVLLRVNTHLKLHDLIRSLRVAVDNLESDVIAAGKIQNALVPKSNPQGLSVEWIYEPSYRVGGDIFDIFKLDENRYFVYLADMSGHGVNAAMLSVMVHRFIEDFRASIYDGEFDLRSFMKELDRNFIFERFNLFFTIVSAIVDFKEGFVLLSNAGHPTPLMQREGSVQFLEGKREALVGINMIHGDVSKVPFRSGDRLLLYTDGLIEVMNEKGEMYGEERLRNLMKSSSDIDIRSTALHLKSSYESFKGSTLAEDDITALLIQF